MDPHLVMVLSFYKSVSGHTLSDGPASFNKSVSGPTLNNDPASFYRSESVSGPIL